ncbi:MAG: amino acid ABC transporter permease [Proteobacteria bacterium]|nr:amino acid ABC transporter permease [Pseudomonadota bacterium]MBI3498104.1 amino acid ABC transporter permease [Pseudomonadota bacterium]
MNYVFQFGIVVDNLPRLLAGAALTVKLAAAATVLGLAIGILGAYLRTNGPRALAWAVAVYIEVFRNTPFLVQLFILYFSLPSLGLRLEANQAALIGMAINFGAYASEILRAGVEAVPEGQIEAGRALGLGRVQVFRRIILFQAIRIVYPALASQFVLLMLGSSVVAAISAEELTAITNTLQSTTFRAFEFYFAATGLYLLMTLGFRAGLGGLYWYVFERGRRAT